MKEGISRDRSDEKDRSSRESARDMKRRNQTWEEMKLGGSKTLKTKVSDWIQVCLHSTHTTSAYHLHLLLLSPLSVTHPNALFTHLLTEPPSLFAICRLLFKCPPFSNRNL